jgi:hypothetical protein
MPDPNTTNIPTVIPEMRNRRMNRQLGPGKNRGRGSGIPVTNARPSTGRARRIAPIVGRRSVQRLYETRTAPLHDFYKPFLLTSYRPKKIKPEPDPEIVKRVEERLANIKVSEAGETPKS